MERINKVLKEYWFVPLSVLIIILINIFGVRICVTVGHSMDPTLHDRELLIMNVQDKTPERYDIIVFKKNGEQLIKRVIGLPGEHIQIIDNDIYINEEKIKDAVNINMQKYGVLREGVTLGENEYFAMGDNRNGSYDCRRFGPIKQNTITGVIQWRFPSFLKIDNMKGE